MKKQYRAYLKRRANRRNIVECYMLRPFGNPVACCCLLLGCCAKLETRQNWKATYKITNGATSPNIVGRRCVRFHVAL